MDLYNIRRKLNLGESISNIPLRVTYYARVSTDHREQKTSLKNQKDYFINYIKSNPNWTYIEGYIDKGISGTTALKREQFMHMIDDAEHGLFDLIITKEISRFSRNTLNSIHYTRKLLEWGVAVLFLNDNINTALLDSELRLTIMSSLAQDEIRRLSERVKFGMKESIKNGHILGNQQLYGYQKNKNSNYLKIVENEATIVQKLYIMYTEKNYSLNKIANLLNQEKIKTKMNKNWNVTTIKRMLENPKYKGYYCGNKTEIIDYMSKKVEYKPKSSWYIYEDKEHIPPIIDEKLWDKTQLKLINESKKITKSIYAFSNKIHCHKDDYIYYPRKQCHDDITWLCSNYLSNNKSSCNTANIRNKELNTIFKDILSLTNIDINKIKNILFSTYNKKVKIEDDIIYNLLIREIVKRIDVDNNELINIHWLLNLPIKINVTKEYVFKRGYDTKTTKRYIVKYLSSFISK